MRAIFLGAAALTTLTSVALGADLPARRAVPVYAPPPPPIWTGFYIGFNAGADFNSSTSYGLTGNTAATNAALAAGVTSPFFKTNANGFIGGGQIGYNYQLGNGFGTGDLALGGNPGGVVLGFEADIDGLSDSGTGNFVGTTGVSTFYHSRTDVLGTARGRLGYAFGNVLVYGTGGFAYGEVHDRVSILGGTAATTFAGILSGRVQTGIAYGGGVEYAIPASSFVNLFKASVVTVKAEFIRYDLGSPNILLNNAANATYNARLRTGGDVARIGVNYKFSQPVAPVVARY